MVITDINTLFKCEIITLFVGVVGRIFPEETGTVPAPLPVPVVFVL